MNGNSGTMQRRTVIFSTGCWSAHSGKLYGAAIILICHHNSAFSFWDKVQPTEFFSRYVRDGVDEYSWTGPAFPPSCCELFERSPNTEAAIVYAMVH